MFVGEPISPQQEDSLLRLGRYLVKSPVSLQRLNYDKETCTVTYSSEKRGEVRTVAAMDFLAMLSVHVPDKGEQTTRYYGRASNVSRGRRRKAAEAETAPPPASETLPDTP
ncbi:MAG: transposase [Candidatus Xenobia bacterium]